MRDEPITIGPARPEEWEPAFQLVFRELDANAQPLRVDNAVEMVRQGELDPAGVVVARVDARVMGVMVSLPAAGGGGLVWPPRVGECPERADVEDRLVNHSTEWLRQRGAKLAQALVPPEEAGHALPLLRNGFRHITDLFYMRHNLADSGRGKIANARLTYQTYENCDPHVFHDTLQRTYENTMDCPEVNGVRAIGDVIAGHKAQGKHDPSRWWLALADGRPVGVLLLAELTDLASWELSYVGVVPEAHRQGFGHELTIKAIEETRKTQALELTLAVDARNLPALHLYRTFGFEETGRRHVYLAIWDREPTNGRQSQHLL